MVNWTRGKDMKKYTGCRSLESNGYRKGRRTPNYYITLSSTIGRGQISIRSKRKMGHRWRPREKLKRN